MKSMNKTIADYLRLGVLTVAIGAGSVFALDQPAFAGLLTLDLDFIQPKINLGTSYAPGAG